MTPGSIWLVGSPQDVGTHLADVLAARPESRSFGDLDEAQRRLADGPQTPELIVLAQSRPGEFTEAAVRAVGRSAPLARVWRVVGAWCEGEGRSAPPPAGCASVYWHQWPARWGRELARARRGELPTWTLPPTASPEERMLEVAAEPLARGAGPVAVFARDPASAAALADVCQLGGYEPVLVDAACLGPLPAAHTSRERTILWDAAGEQIGDPAEIEKLRAVCGPGPIVAVAGFIRGDDCRRAAQAGVAAVVTKPYLIHDLLWELAGVMAEPQVDSFVEPQRGGAAIAQGEALGSPTRSEM